MTDGTRSGSRFPARGPGLWEPGNRAALKRMVSGFAVVPALGNRWEPGTDHGPWSRFHPAEQRRPLARARHSRMPSTMAQLGHRTRIRSTARDAALACAVLAEQRELGPVRHEPATANLGHLTAAREHASGSSRTRAARIGAQSATARVAHRPGAACTWTPGALRCALFRVPYLRVSPRDVPCIRAVTQRLTHFEGCSAVSRWGILTLRTTLTRTGDHDTSTALLQAKLSCRRQSRAVLGLSANKPTWPGASRWESPARRWPMKTGHEHGMGPKGAQEHALGLNDCERSHAFPNMASGQEGGKP